MSSTNVATGKLLLWIIFLAVVLVFGVIFTREMEISSDKIVAFVSTVAGGIFFAAAVDALVAAYRAAAKKNIDVKISIDGRDVHIILPVDDKEKLREILRNISKVDINNEKKEG